MKTISVFAGLLAAFFVNSAFAATNIPPQFQNVVAVQRPGTMVVDVTYDLVDPDSPWVYVTAQFSTNGGASYFVPFSPLTGNFGPVTPGTNRKLTWNAFNDFPNNYTTNAKVLLFGDDSASASGPVPTNAPDGNTNLVYIPAGVFSFCISNTPVYISRSFWMGKFEVTWAEYGNTNNPPNLPANNITWNQAVTYCQTLTANQIAAGKLPAGWAYRLPTEAEWEYACRAGTTNTYYFGEDPSHTRLLNYAWFNANSGGGQHNVGLKAPNRWGLYDMAGNVAEWCSDWYSPNLPATGVTDPTGPAFQSMNEQNQAAGKVARGGGFDYTYSGEASASRDYFGTATDASYDVNNVRSGDLGFRVVLAPAQ